MPMSPSAVMLKHTLWDACAAARPARRKAPKTTVVGYMVLSSWSLILRHFDCQSKKAIVARVEVWNGIQERAAIRSIYLLLAAFHLHSRINAIVYASHYIALFEPLITSVPHSGLRSWLTRCKKPRCLQA